ncbi:DeoR family transcriptional regulator [Enterococcus pingfangensis]|uniref:DeoR family transcriptional regulator n=1 Tax=Enterococcus pingfangensis TaxID=2559924 RepID=UPI0010F657E1|nr:DeoR family transcriptional regulator [Enterococcus pingfangensis]
MIWQAMTGKKCHRQLRLIELLQNECYSVSELADQTKVSAKTILRDLTELRQKNYVRRAKYWQINWQHEPNSAKLYRKLLLSDPCFQLFRQYLWNLGTLEANDSQLKKLNQSLIRWNLFTNLQSGGLIGKTAVIIHLQLRYLRDFYQFDEAELYKQLEAYCPPVSDLLNPALFPDRKMVENFIKKFGLSAERAEYFFLDYTRYHYQFCADFYRSHQVYRTGLYREIRKTLILIERMTDWETELTKKIVETKLFELFLGIYQGLPLAVMYPSQVETTAENFYILSKKMKQLMPLLSNCRLDELASALETIFSSSRQIVLALNPDLSSSLLIQERYQAFLSFTEGK